MLYQTQAPIVGTRYRPIEAQVIAQSLHEGEVLHLERDPTNQYDWHAIKVIARGHFIGFIPASKAAEIAPIIDSKNVTINAVYSDGQVLIILTEYEIIPTNEP